MGSRLKLQEELEKLLGTRNVYFQPPPSLKMKYPCIVYERARINTQYADNLPYKLDMVYYVTSIDSNPDSEIPKKLSWFPKSAFQRHYVSDNLYHDQYRIIF